jgi:aminopeptidase N
MLIDAVVYTDDMKVNELKDIFIQDKEMTEVPINLQGKVALVILNYGDHTYAKVRFDPMTLTNLKKMKLIQVKDDLTRALVWRNLWHHVMDMKLTSTDYYTFV